MSSRVAADLVVLGARQLLTMSHPSAHRGPNTGDLGMIPDGTVAVDSKLGAILAAGPWEELKQSIAITDETQVVRAAGKVVMPAFVDPHTHPVFAGSRVDEFLLRSRGVSYMEIHSMGGGIGKTVRETRKASRDDLLQSSLRVLSRMMEHGTATIEAKSGYGLTVEDEIKLLRVLSILSQASSVEIVPTFLGAHMVPEEFRDRPGEYVQLVKREMIPAIGGSRLAKFCDVFCEKGVFSIEESREILLSGKLYSLIPKLHADEFSALGGAQLAVEVQAASADHLLEVSHEGIEALAGSNTVAVLLPCTSFFLDVGKYAPARELIDGGAVVALATDYNAGSCMTESMQMAISLAVMRMKMTPEEALVAATINAAHAIQMAGRVGWIGPGKQADLIVLSVPDYREIPYHPGVNLVERVIKKGKIVR